MAHVPLVHRREQGAETDKRRRGTSRVIPLHRYFRAERQPAEPGTEGGAGANREAGLTRDQRPGLADVEQLGPMPQLDANDFFRPKLGARPSPPFDPLGHESHAFDGCLPIAVNPRLDLRE
jgi:hypothetical protein